MIQNDTTILDGFSKEFNSRFNSSDFVKNIDKLVRITNNPNLINEKQLMYLPCSEEVFQQLVAFRYKELLTDIIKRIKIEHESNDIFLSEMQFELFQIYSYVLLKMVEVTDVTINTTNSNFEIICPNLFIELLWSPISQFHSQVLIELEYYNKLLKRIENITKISSEKPAEKHLVINYKGATAYSYFILAFIAQNLNIPLKYS